LPARTDNGANLTADIARSETVKLIVGLPAEKGKRPEMNALSIEKRIQVISALVEGNSIRSTERMTEAHRDTIMRLLVRVGENCARLLDEKMRHLPCRVIQCDEIWSFVYVKQRHLNGDHDREMMGDQYIFVALDPESKLIPTFRVGKRTPENAYYFMADLQERLAHRVQLTTDGFRPYLTAVEDTFGADVDYAMLVKLYGSPREAEERYSPDEIVQAVPIPVTGNPKPSYISTSHVERQNLTIRMQLRRFTRLTNAFSKKLENLKAAIALHFAYYNFCRIHQTLRVTPAMAAGVAETVCGIGELFGSN
jgi:IS1 family transposase